VDNVLVMSAPGFTAALHRSTYGKIGRLADLRSEHGRHFSIQVDGGVNQTTPRASPDLA
jgi:pentose-5-phosphate-3-epimerase